MHRGAEESQLGLWSHFQNERPASFDGSRGRLDTLIRYAERRVSGRSLLNVGCGNGYLERQARDRGWDVVSVDPDSRSVEKLASTGIDARCGVIQSLPVDSESIDAAICSEVLEHIPGKFLKAAIDELRRVLVPNGVLIGTVPYREDLAESEVFCPRCNYLFHRWGHQQSFDEAKIRSLLAPAFKVQVVRQKYFPAWKSPNWKNRLATAGRFAFSLIGIYGSSTNLLFIAVKKDP